LLLTRVLDRLLEAEREMSSGEARKKALLTSANYRMSPSGEESLSGRLCKIIDLNPKLKATNLLKGRAWIDANDYSLVRIEGRPAASPSFWAGRPMIVRDYENIQGFPLAKRSHAVSDSFLLGRTELTIEYDSYRITTVRSVRYEPDKWYSKVSMVAVEHLSK
jgi:hypothetical protein